MWILSGIQFTRHFIEIIGVQTKPFVSSHPNVILTRQTCGQRSSMAAGSKRRALDSIFPCEFTEYFVYQNIEESLIWVCAQRQDLQTECCSSDQKTRLAAKCVGSWHCAAALFWQVPKLCTDLHLTLSHILILRTYTKFEWKHKMLALGVCFPQPCSSAGHRIAASRSRLDHFGTFGSLRLKRNRQNAL